MRRIGVLVAVIVLLFALGRITSVVVDWAWFSSIGYGARLLDRFRRKGRSLCRCLFRLDPASLGERDLGVAVCGNAAGAASGVRSLCHSSGVARADGGIARASAIAIAMAFAHLRPRVRPRIAYRQGGDRQLGPDPTVRLPVAIRRERLAVRQGHRLLPLFAAGVRRGQELAAVDPAARHLDDRFDLLPSRRYQSRSSSQALFVRGNRSWLRAARSLFRDQGLVLCLGPIPHALQRQRRCCRLPALWLLIGLAAVAAIVAWANVRLRTIRLLIAAPLLVFGGSFLFAELIPGIFERFFVKPNELRLETPYIRQNIALTLRSLQPRPDLRMKLHFPRNRISPFGRSRTTAGPSTTFGFGIGNR